VRYSLGLLSRRDRRLFILAILIQMGTSGLDLVGVLLVGLVGLVAVSAVQSQPLPPPAEAIADWLGLGALSEQTLVLTLAGVAAAVLLAKSVLSSYLTRRVLLFLAHRQALVAARLARALLGQPHTFVQKRSSQETSFALIQGSAAATSRILGSLATIATEASLLLVLGFAVLVVSPAIALGAITFFLLIALALQRVMGHWASRVGETKRIADVGSLNAIQEALSSYREIAVSGRRSFYVERIEEFRWKAAKVTADSTFIGLFPKYMFEAALVVGGFLLAGALFATQEANVAVGTLALFLAAGTRVTPSLLRLQGAALAIRVASGEAVPTYALAEELRGSEALAVPAEAADDIIRRVLQGHTDFVPSIIVSGVVAEYPLATSPAIAEVSLEVEAGQSVALVGPSGAGKSTLADVLLSVLEPSQGQVSLGGIPVSEALTKWPGAVSYVPQDVAIANDTIRANVALGLPSQFVVDDLVWEALEKAHLADDIRSRGDSLDSKLGERGLRLSGGQRQRLGLARALYTRPRLLVLDEATSALDAETESNIGRTIQDLSGEVTVVVIAHRLATIRDVDLVVYLEKGRVVAQGPFEFVRSQVPDFDRQARLLGLRSEPQ